jgi:isoleucyl-tRNA synthetase
MQNTGDVPSKQKKGSKGKVGSSSETQKDGKNSADKAYASTLLLPKTKFPIWIEPVTVQERYQERTTRELYKWQVRALSSSFVSL